MVLAGWRSPEVCRNLSSAPEALTSGTLLKPSVEDLKGLGDQVAPSPFMIQEL